MSRMGRGRCRFNNCIYCGRDTANKGRVCSTCYGGTHWREMKSTFPACPQAVLEGGMIQVRQGTMLEITSECPGGL